MRSQFPITQVTFRLTVPLLSSSHFFFFSDKKKWDPPVGLGKKLGNLVKGTGEGVKEFKKALEEGKDDDEKKED